MSSHSNSCDEERRDTVHWLVERDTTLAEGDTVAFALRDELREVMINLLENARLAGPHCHRAGVAGIRARGYDHETPHLPRLADERSHGLAIEVTDDGVGIARRPCRGCSNRTSRRVPAGVAWGSPSAAD